MIQRLSTHYKHSLHASNTEYGAERKRYELLETSWEIAKRSKRTLNKLIPSPIKSQTLQMYMLRTDDFYINRQTKKLKLDAIPEAEDDNDNDNDNDNEHDRDTDSQASSMAPSLSITHHTDLTDGSHSPKIHTHSRFSSDMSNDFSDHSVVSNTSSTAPNTPTMSHASASTTPHSIFMPAPVEQLDTQTHRHSLYNHRINSTILWVHETKSAAVK